METYNVLTHIQYVRWLISNRQTVEKLKDLPPFDLKWIPLSKDVTLLETTNFINLVDIHKNFVYAICHKPYLQHVHWEGPYEVPEVIKTAYAMYRYRNNIKH